MSTKSTARPNSAKVVPMTTNSANVSQILRAIRDAALFHFMETERASL